MRQLMIAFDQSITETNTGGGMLFAVCRGKVSCSNYANFYLVNTNLHIELKWFNNFCKLISKEF
jgi:hypothetical protein